MGRREMGAGRRGRLLGYARRRRNVLLLYALAYLTAASQGSLEFVLPLGLHHLRYTLPLVGLTVAAMSVGALGSRLPGGAGYRQERARLLIVASFLAAGLPTAALAATLPLPALAALVAFHGIGFGLCSTFILALLVQETAGDRHPTTSMAWFTAAVSTGYAVASPLAAASIDRLGYPGAFLVSGGLGLLGGVAAVALEPAPREGADPRPRARAGALHSIRGLPPGVWLATLLVFYINFLTDATAVFFPIRAVASGTPVAVVGLLMSVNSVSGMGTRFAAAGLLTRLPARLANHLSVLAMAAAGLGTALATSPVAMGAALAVMGLCRGLIRVTTATSVAVESRRPGAPVGIASGLYNMGLDAGALAAPPVTGAVAGLSGIPAALATVAVVLPALYYALWLLGAGRGPGRSRGSGPPCPPPGR